MEKQIMDESTKATLRKLLDKQRARKIEDDKERASRVFIREKKDINSEKLFWATDIMISVSYDGSLDFLREIPNIERLHCFRTMTKEQLEEIDLSAIEDLYLIVEDANEDIFIAAPWMKKMTLSGSTERLSPLERMLLEKSRLDISRCKRLEVLELRNYDGYDISSIGLLKRLKSLRLSRMKFEDFEWLKDCNNLEILVIENCEFLLETLPALPHLKSLSIYYGGLDSIKGLPVFPELEVLDLSYNNITDVSELSKIKTLKKLDLYHNPIQNIDNVIGLGIGKTIITKNDREQEGMASKVQFLLSQSYLRLERFESDLKEGRITNPYILKKIKREKKTQEERFLEYFTWGVESEFKGIRPYVNTPNEEYPETNLREAFIAYIEENYPFVKMPNELYAQIDREKAGIKAFYQAKSGFVFFVRDHLYAIEMSFQPYQEERIRVVDWDEQRPSYLRELETTLNKVLELSVDERVRVRILDFYGNARGEGLEVGILAAYASLKHNIIVPLDIYYTGKIGRKNAFKSESPSSRTIDEAQRQGCKHLVVFSAAKTSDYNPEGIEIEFYKKIDDFFKEREAIGVEEVQLEIEGLGAFPNKQTQ